MCELWVNDPWTSTIDSRGVSITYKSGGETYRRRMSRADYRRGLEFELCKLDEFEASLRDNVTALRAPRH